MRLVRLFALVLLLAAAVPPAHAQPGERPDRGDRMIERRVDRLTFALGLSSDQAVRVRELLHARADDARRRSEAIRDALDARCGTPGTRPEAEQRTCVHRALRDLRAETPIERMRREHTETNRSIRAMLSAEQAARFDALVQEENGRFERRLPRANGTAPGSGRPGTMGPVRPDLRPGTRPPSDGRARPGPGGRPDGDRGRPPGGEGGGHGGRGNQGGGRPGGHGFVE
ncbi:MAG: hypothetical protein IAE99_10540 [Rhodothermales bacterium]|nr:hypothetical protein [Rhodothermales bacterium]